MEHFSELLMPAGSLLKLKTAILYGADAVYCGTPDLSLRTKSAFTLEELQEGIAFAHARGKRVYLTLNLFSHNKDIAKLPQFLDTVRKVKPDGVIIADPGVFQFVKDHAPELELHISTQANVCSWVTVDFWQKQGAKLVVLAREVSFEEIKEIRERCPDTKLEMFVHGSMCMTYSGRCLLSNFMAERGANQGNCAQSCRWNYKVHVKLKDGTTQELEINEQNKDMFEFLMEEEFRPGEMIPIEEDSRGSYILNAKDMCLLPRIPEIIDIGIDSLKVEGRHKTNYYAAMVAWIYRRAMDAYRQDPANWSPEPYMHDLYTIQNRGYTLAFHDGRLTNLAHNYDNAKSIASYEYAGYITEWQGDDIIFEVKNTLEVGELLEFISPLSPDPIRVRLPEYVHSVTGEALEKVHPGQNTCIRIPASIFARIDQAHIRDVLPTLAVARKKKPLSPLELARLKTDLEAQKAEIEHTEMDMEKKAQLLAAAAQREALIEKKINKPKGPKMGIDGCCGKGCNGCMIFWNDPKYEEKRKEMLTKKIGEKL